MLQFSNHNSQPTIRNECNGASIKKEQKIKLSLTKYYLYPILCISDTKLELDTLQNISPATFLFISNTCKKQESCKECIFTLLIRAGKKKKKGNIIENASKYSMKSDPFNKLVHCIIKAIKSL